ncbi:Hypothetical predicted protein [Cloeon dipterum]|uniref:Uncharacterized protein n=1 Tax=Cloeon dipterum TaxID=197152 RepID=A0A8S1DVZ7_9INSE|nr:Hypothetical predicted protein [Cloeon dipterum]
MSTGFWSSRLASSDELTRVTRQAGAAIGDLLADCGTGSKVVCSTAPPLGGPRGVVPSDRREAAPLAAPSRRPPTASYWLQQQQHSGPACETRMRRKASRNSVLKIE